MGEGLNARTRLVSVVLVTWNSAEYLPACISGLGAQTHEPLELIAIDNASADRSVSLLEGYATRLVRNGENRGFSAAVNQALQIARGDFVLLVNPDCRMEPEYV